MRRRLVVLAVTFFTTTLFASGPWQVIGPDGGDARSLAYDAHNPDHVFLGTSTGQMFTSNDGGRNGPASPTSAATTTFSITSSSIRRTRPHLCFGLEHLQPATWRDLPHRRRWPHLGDPARHARQVHPRDGHVSRQFDVLVAGALDGVYRTKDGGSSWEHLNSASSEVKNVESIAVDPQDANTVYAGTWHLAWKMFDGGVNWQHINKGMIDDFDVFSVIVDHDNPQVVFASACSVIYKSDSAGNQFSKIQGIPFTARRTRVLKQDPTNENIVYAGTTEGLWKTVDLGKTWKRVSSEEVVVNDVFVDPRNSNHVVIATDRSGIMASMNGAATWETSNHGYAHRYVSALLADNQNANTLYVGLVNDREYGHVLFARPWPALDAKSRRPRRARRVRFEAKAERHAGRWHQSRHLLSRE